MSARDDMERAADESNDALLHAATSYRFSVGERLRFAPKTGVGMRGESFTVIVTDRELDYDGPVYTLRFANGGNARLVAYEAELSK